MPAKVRIPAPLRKLTQDQAIVEVDGKTIQDLLNSLDKNYPGLKDRICDESGQIRRFVNVFVNGEDIRFKDGAGARAGKVTAGRVLVDGKAHGDIHDAVLKDRRRLAQDGIILVIIGVNRQTGEVQIKVRKALRKFVDRRLERRPLILPTVIEI